MNKNIAFLFPGQGAQYVGMGKDFYDNFSIARQLYEQAEDLLKTKITKLIFEGPELSLKKTFNSQVAIFVTEVALLEVLKNEFSSVVPKVCAGLSLGEYTALCAANKIFFKDALLLVQKRAKYMNDSCEKNKGIMAAVIGLNADIIEETLKKINPPQLVWIANYNTFDQTVISGSIEGVNAASKALREKGAKKVVELKVHGAFHSGLMIESQERLAPDIEKTDFHLSEVDIVMNVSGNYARSIEEIKRNLNLQITHSIRWKQSIEIMQKNEIAIFLEIGPSQTLTMMNKKSKINGCSINLDKISDLEKIAYELR